MLNNFFGHYPSVFTYPSKFPNFILIYAVHYIHNLIIHYGNNKRFSSSHQIQATLLLDHPFLSTSHILRNDTYQFLLFFLFIYLIFFFVFFLVEKTEHYYNHEIGEDQDFGHRISPLIEDQGLAPTNLNTSPVPWHLKIQCTERKREIQKNYKSDMFTVKKKIQCKTWT